MNTEIYIERSNEYVEIKKNELIGMKRLRLFLYWLAGARWATLVHVPESERERIAVLGSSVLIPTLLAFFGMYLYVASRFCEPRPITSLFIALIWALVIMNVDRILLATYRPFQSRLRKAVQISFRIILAGVISLAITFPFCLHLYRGAISERLQSEFRKPLENLQNKERSERTLFEAADALVLNDLRAKLEREYSIGPIDPQLYAEILAKQDWHQQADNERMDKEKIDKEIETILERWKGASTQIFEIEQKLRQEEKGSLSAELGGTGKPGRAAKYNELLRNLSLSRQAELLARQQYDQLLKLAVPEQTPDMFSSRSASSAANQKHAAYIQEAELRKARVEVLNQSLKKAEASQVQHLEDHNSRYNPLIQSYQAKISGRFDPMEETIGLFKVIFVPALEGDGATQAAQQYTWIAAFIQFGIVFGTLFLLDLIAIISKVMSHPGPYDVLVEFPEFVSRRNIIAFENEYQVIAGSMVNRQPPPPPVPGVGGGVDLRDHGLAASVLLHAYLPMPIASRRQEHGGGRG